MKVQFQQWACIAEFNTYRDGGTVSIELYTEDKEPVADATVNLADLAKDELAIKDYSHTEGLLSTLILAEVVQPPHRYAKSGFVTIPIVKLTQKAIDHIGETKLIRQHH